MEPPRTYPVVVPDTALSSCRHAATSQCRYVGFYIGKIPAKTLTLGNSQNQRLLNILAHASGRLIYRKTGRSAVKQTHTVHGANETKIMQDINSFVVAKRTLHKIICLCNFSKFNNNSNTVIINNHHLLLLKFVSFTCFNFNIVLSLHAETIKHQTIISKRLY